MTDPRRSSWIIVGLVVALAAGCARPAAPPQAPSAAPTPALGPISLSTPAPAPTVAAPAATPAAVAPVTDVQVESSGSSQVLAGLSVPVKLRFSLSGTSPRQVEVGLAWRASGGPSGQGDLRPYNATPGQNVAADLPWSVPPMPAGSQVEVFGTVRVDGTTLTSPRGVVFTVLADPGSQRPAVQPTPNPSAGAPNPPADVPAPAQPAEDPGIARVRAALTEKGLQVRYVGYNPADAQGPASLVAVVDANYTQPGGNAVLALAGQMWQTLYEHYPIQEGAAASTIFGAGQQWTKYVILLNVRVDHLAALFGALRQNLSDEQREATVQAFLQTVVVWVWDLERQEFMDSKDFISKNFTGQ